MDPGAYHEARVPGYAVFVWSAPRDVSQDAIKPGPLQAEGKPHDQDLFDEGTVTVVFLVEIEGFRLRSDHRRTDDEITALIEAIVDDLDQSSIEPSVSTVRDGNDVLISVAMHVDEDDELDAWASAASSFKSALHAAHIGGPAPDTPRELRSRVTPLQAA